MRDRLSCGFACAGVLAVLLACKGKETPTLYEATAPVPPPPTVKLPMEVVQSKTTLASAVQYASTFSDPKMNEHSATTILVAAWAIKKMQWSDVAVAEDEVNYAVAKKNIDAARGKRLCVSGTLVQITANKAPLVGTDEGIIMSGAGNLFYFLTIGSSGDLVAQSWARICAVVTDEYDYTNSGGGTGHAIDLVGIFDLPGNKVVRGTISADQLPKAN